MSHSAPGGGSGPAAPVPSLDQYKAYLGDLGNIGSRNATSNGFYLSVITAVLGVLALGKPDGGLMNVQPVLRIAVPAFAMLLCLAWYQNQSIYRHIFATKFGVLREMEQLGHLYPAYEREEELRKKRRVGFLTRNEGLVPLLFALLFLIVGAAAVTASGGK